jgi:hypothetical protein
MRLRTAARRAGRAVAQPRRAAGEAAVLRDYVAFRSAARVLRDARPRRTGVGTALIVSLSDLVYQLKLETVLGTAVRLEGYRPVVLTHRNTLWAERYLRAGGLHDIVYSEDLAPGDEARQVAGEFLAGDVTVQGLKHFEFRGAHVGAQALSTLSRAFLRGRISLDDPDVRTALGHMLPDAIEAVFAAEAVIDRARPDVVLFNERGYAGFGSVYDVALDRGTNVIQWVHAGIHSPDALLLKRYTSETRRLHPSSLSRDTWERVRSLEWTLERERALREEFDFRYGPGSKHPDAGLQQGKAMKAPEEVRAELALDPGKRTATIFSHILWDATLFYGEDLFEDQEKWFVESVRAACENPQVNWIVKLHPANAWKTGAAQLNDELAIREAVGELPPHVKVLRPETDINTYSLFAVTDYGVTIRGTIGLELPCFGIRTLTAGTGRYAGLGFTDDSATAGEYLDKLRRIHELPPLDEETTLLAKRHAYTLFRLRPFPFSTHESVFPEPGERKSRLMPNVRLRVRTAEEVELASDLREFAEWAADRHALDYLRAAD